MIGAYYLNGNPWCMGTYVTCLKWKCQYMCALSYDCMLIANFHATVSWHEHDVKHLPSQAPHDCWVQVLFALNWQG